MVKFVRLACLMCAASVYPEPGSNSQYNFEFFQALFINFNFLIFFWFTFWYFSISRKSPFGLFSKGFYCLLFNVLFSVHLVWTKLILAYLFLVVNTFLKNILNIFYHFLGQNKKLVIDVFCIFLFLLFTNSCVLFFKYFCLLLGTVIILTPLSKFVNTFLKFS